MDPLTGALLASAVGWASIFLAVHLPGGRLPVQAVRRVGAVTIALLGLMVLGVPLHGAVPVLVLIGGVLLVWLTGPKGAAAA